MQTQNKLFDDLARVANGAVSTVMSMKDEIDALVRQKIERYLNSADLVSREEFEVVKAMAAKAREENDALQARIAALEAAAKPASKPKAKRATPAKKASSKAKS